MSNNRVCMQYPKAFVEWTFYERPDRVLSWYGIVDIYTEDRRRFSSRKIVIDDAKNAKQAYKEFLKKKDALLKRNKKMLYEGVGE